MVRQGWDWNSLPTMVSTTRFLSRDWGEIWLVTFLLSTPRMWALESSLHITVAWLFQCLLICIINGETRLRLEFIAYNGLNNTPFEPWFGRNLACHVPTFHTKNVSSGILAAYHCHLTVPMSPYMYNKWLDKVENGIHCLQWSQQANFWAVIWKKFGLSGAYFPHQECELWDPRCISL